MATLSPTTLESTPSGSTNLGAIIDGNWTILNSLFDPSLSSGSALYNVVVAALIKSATMPTGPARLEWRPGSPSKPAFRLVYSAVTYSGTLTIAPATAINQYVAVTGNPTISFSTFAAGDDWTLILEASGGTRTITWPASIRWLSGAAPTSIPSGKILSVTFRAKGSTASDLLATFTLEP